MGPQRIVWYLERYLDIKTSDATVYQVSKRHGQDYQVVTKRHSFAPWATHASRTQLA